MEVESLSGRLYSKKYMGLVMYTIKKHDNTGDGMDKYVVYKGDKPLMLPCKLTKRQIVQFGTEIEARKYIANVLSLINTGKEYLEIY